jgi:hypothetical protein
VKLQHWSVVISLEPEGRETYFPIVAETGIEAMTIALRRVKLKPDELLHTIHAHIGPPQEIEKWPK